MLPTLSPRSQLSDVLTGLALLPRAVWLMLKTPKLLGLALVSAAVTAGVLLGSAFVLWPLSHDWAARLIHREGSGWTVATATLGVFFFCVSWAVCALTVPALVLSPLQDPLSEATESALGDFTPEPFSLRGLERGVIESLRHTLQRLGFMLAGSLLLLPLNLIPVAGSVLWAVGSATWSMFWLCAEYVSGPAARHLQPFGQVVGALRRRLPLALGLGAGLFVVLWVPVVNAFVVPVAVVAGTLMFRALKQANLLGRTD